MDNPTASRRWYRWILGVAAALVIAMAALIAFSGLTGERGSKEKGYRTQLIWAVMSIAEAESTSMADSGRYTKMPRTDIPQLVLFNLQADDTSWSVIADHQRLQSYACAIAVKRPNLIAPDSVSGERVCGDPTR